MNSKAKFQVVREVLQKEDDLNEIVQLVGKVLSCHASHNMHLNSMHNT